ncbi:50S ribosomal protein L24 [Patescibacteria group bacterium]|nr:50S ribosomal protein L24 [Patescibacteria group bacterium]
MKIHKNDHVLIISGKDRGKTGKVLSVLSEKSKIVVEGVNLRKKCVRPKKSGEKGQIIQITAPLSSSNVKVICGKCGKASRMGYKINGDKKYRICKKCKQKI